MFDLKLKSIFSIRLKKINKRVGNYTMVKIWGEHSQDGNHPCKGLQGWVGLSEARAAGTEPKGKELEVRSREQRL